ncbi:MAG: SDR family oxidoreductase [Chloroflexota bacterium]|nr:SDR family oxidoreductase [Chloroflexota bacterium]
MKALVTGATGFVGANVVEALGRAGWQVRALRRNSSSMEALKGLAYEPVVGDVTDPSSLLKAMAGCDAVFHVAGVTADYWSQDTTLLYRVNVDGTRNVVEACLASGIERLVFTSSQAALGFSGDESPVDESHQFNLSPGDYPYGHSKHLAEQQVLARVRGGLDAVIVNPSIVMGPRDATLTNSQIILEVAYGRIPLVPPGGVNVVDACDLADGHLLALEKGRSGEKYLLAGPNVTNLYLASEVARVLAVQPPRGNLPRFLVGPTALALDSLARIWPRRLPISGDIIRFGSRFIYADNSKATEQLGFSPSPLTVTIERAVSWLRAEGHL